MYVTVQQLCPSKSEEHGHSLLDTSGVDNRQPPEAGPGRLLGGAGRLCCRGLGLAQNPFPRTGRHQRRSYGDQRQGSPHNPRAGHAGSWAGETAPSGPGTSRQDAPADTRLIHASRRGKGQARDPAMGKRTPKKKRSQSKPKRLPTRLPG